MTKDKKNILLVALAIIIPLVILTAFLFQRGGVPVNSKELRVAFPYNKPANYYDPLKIQLSPEYTFLENTFSPLVEYAPTGELVSALAEHFVWIGNEAHFKIRQGVKTVDGHPINAKDVEQSFKRMMILSGNTHGNLKDMLCPTTEIKTLDDVCPELETREKDTTLVMKFKEKKIFLFPMLAAIDFAIIPRGSYNPKTLDITDYRNTSGPYYVEKDDESGNITLAANPHHFHYSKDIPQKLQLIPAGIKDPKESIKLFSESKVDLITTIDAAPHDALMDYSSNNKDTTNIHSTYPLRIYTVTFTQKGRKRLSLPERIVISRKIKSIFLSVVKNKLGYEQTEQIFPIIGEGALSKEQLSEIKNTFDQVPNVEKFDKPFLGWIVRMRAFEPTESALKIEFPQGKFLAVNKVPSLIDFDKTKEEEPDFIVIGCDMGFLEDISLFNYYLNTEAFYLSKKEGEEWLRNYMTIPEKNDRLKLMRELHFRTIKDAASVPMATSPYTALVRKPWTMNLSKVLASDAIWRISHK